MEEVYVIFWRYSDGSSGGVLRAYADRDRANEDMDLLNDDCSGKVYELTEVSVYK